jgi:hypothetical protein
MQPPDYESENRALVALVEVMTAFPDDICRTLVDTALRLCSAFYCHARSGAGRQEARS